MKFAGSDNSQFVDFQGRTFLSYLLCRVGHFSVSIFQSIAVLLYKLKNDADSEFDVNASIALCIIEEQNSRLVPIKCFIEKNMVRVLTQIQIQVIS